MFIVGTLVLLREYVVHTLTITFGCRGIGHLTSLEGSSVRCCLTAGTSPGRPTSKACTQRTVVRTYVRALCCCEARWGQDGPRSLAHASGQWPNRPNTTRQQVKATPDEQIVEAGQDIGAPNSPPLSRQSAIVPSFPRSSRCPGGHTGDGRWDGAAAWGRPGPITIAPPGVLVLDGGLWHVRSINTALCQGRAAANERRRV